MNPLESFAAARPRKENDLEAANLAASSSEEQILGQFSPEEQRIIRERMRALSLIPNHIGKDFSMEVELNAPGEGWHWDFSINHVRIDPKDLVEKPLDWCRAVMAHEGGHRRISRTSFIPEDVWAQPGFSSMMNAIEDPRMENFITEAYPPYRTLQKTAYEHDLEMEKRMKESAGEKLGRQPRFMQAGFEYIKQWFRQSQGKQFEFSPDLPEDVRKVVRETLGAAEDSWFRYPTRAEADESEETIEAYAKKSYEINRDRVWPHFKELVDKDVKDQELPEFLKDLMKGGPQQGEGQPGEPSSADIENLKEALKEALKQSAGQPGEGQPAPFDSLPEDLKQKLQEAFDALPEDKKQAIRQAAEQAVREVAGEFDEQFEGEYVKAGEPQPTEPRPGEGEPESSWSDAERSAEDDRREMRKRMEESLERLEGNAYQAALAEVAPLIDALTGDLRDVFVKRKQTRTEAGYRSGRRWNVRTRIKEKIAGIPLLKTQSREQPESPGEETDYAVLLQVDLSGSMRSGGKAREAFKSVVLLSETLANLGIRHEIDGFQDILLEFKRFEEELNDAMREKLNQLPLEIENENPGGHNNCGDNDDGACLKAASAHLALQGAAEKILIVLSDGQPVMDSGRKSHAQLDRELKEAVRDIRENTDQKLIGVGIESSAVSRYYENDIPNVGAKELAETLGELLREVIERS